MKRISLYIALYGDGRYFRRHRYHFLEVCLVDFGRILLQAELKGEQPPHEAIRHEERLEETIHVASGPLKNWIQERV